MNFLDSIEIASDDGSRQIELWQGDLTKLPAGQRVDALVVSAFPDDFTPTDRSLIGALHRAGVSVADLALDKDIDLRATMSCWLSRKLAPSRPDLGFDRVVVFEPLVRGKPPEVVGDIFRFLTPVVTVRPEIRSVALPIVAAGDQRYPVAEILQPMLDAAIHWLDAGLDLDRIIVVAHSETAAIEARQVFLEAKSKIVEPSTKVSPGAPTEYDAFISYSHLDAPDCDALVHTLRSSVPRIRLFVDRHALDVGVSWQMKIYESLDRCRRVVTLLSPSYLNSKMCLEEFNIALARGHKESRQVVFPVYLYSADLPTYMTMHQYADCREGDASHFGAIAAALREES